MTFAAPKNTAPAQNSVNIRTFLLLLLLCVTALCPTSWQSLTHSQKIASAMAATVFDRGNPLSALTATGSLSGNDWAWEGLADAGRQTALTAPGLTPVFISARSSEQDEKRFAWNSADFDSATPFSRGDEIIPSLTLLSLSAPESGDISSRLPAARGLVRFALPPPTHR